MRKNGVMHMITAGSRVSSVSPRAICIGALSVMP